MAGETGGVDLDNYILSRVGQIVNLDDKDRVPHDAPKIGYPISLSLWKFQGFETWGHHNSFPGKTNSLVS